GVLLANGGQRVIAPNSGGSLDTLRVAWTNQVAFDSVSLRVFRTDGTVIGSVAMYGTAAGNHAYDWDGHVGGGPVPSGVYVLQVRGLRGSVAYSAPSASPVSPANLGRFGVIVAGAAPTSIIAFGGPSSPTRATSLTWTITFGGPNGGFSQGG